MASLSPNVQRTAKQLIEVCRKLPFLRLVIDGPRRMMILRRRFGHLVRWKPGLVGDRRFGTTLCVTNSFPVDIRELLCMQPNYLDHTEPVKSYDLSLADLMYFDVWSKRKHFYSISQTISFAECLAASEGRDKLGEFLGQIDRFGPAWAADRERRTQFLVEHYLTSPQPPKFSVIVDVLRDGSLVLRDGYHRTSMAALRGENVVMCRLRA